MRLLLTSVTCPKGQLELNQARHLALLAEGAAADCDLVLLPEMSLTGYRPAAAVELDDPAVSALVQATWDRPALCFGLVENGPADHAPLITQVVAARGQVVAVHRKAHLGDGESEDFTVGVAAESFEVAGTTVALAMCAEIGSTAPYGLGSRLVLAPAAPGLYGDRRTTPDDWRRGFDWWRGSVVDDARRLLRPGQLLAVSTQAGATDDEDFPGWAALLSAGGRVLAELPDWREATLVVDTPSR